MSAVNNSIGKLFLDSLDKPCSRIRNSSGLRTEPWCTPTLTLEALISLPFILNFVNESSYIAFITDTIYSSTPRYLRVYQITFRDTYQMLSLNQQKPFLCHRSTPLEFTPPWYPKLIFSTNIPFQTQNTPLQNCIPSLGSFPSPWTVYPDFDSCYSHFMPYRMTPSVKHRAIEVHYYYYCYYNYYSQVFAFRQVFLLQPSDYENIICLAPPYHKSKLQIM